MTADLYSHTVDAIVAFAFGNRLDPSAGPDAVPRPGPVNEALADLVYALYQRHPLRKRRRCTVWAQWEVAMCLEETHRLPAESLCSIGPVTDDAGIARYLSTSGVVEAVVTAAGGAVALGQVAVVAHRDHIERCLRLCRQASIAAVRADELQPSAGAVRLSLPGFYDAESGQPWTRSRAQYLRHEDKMSGR